MVHNNTLHLDVVIPNLQAAPAVRRGSSRERSIAFVQFESLGLGRGVRASGNRKKQVSIECFFLLMYRKLHLRVRIGESYHSM